MKEIKTTCPYCGVGCGVIATLGQDGNAEIKADPDHPANYGRLCSKGAALADTISDDGRLLYPEVEGKTEDWSQALNYVAEKFSTAISDYGPDSVAFYVSGQLLTEDYYVANKLMKGFIGSGNIDTNSRLCMSSAVAGYKRAFGSDTVPCSYEDLERAKLIIITGANMAWCHPVLFQRIKKAKKENPDMMVVVIDPRSTSTCDIADLHLPLKPATDLDLFNGLLAYLDKEGEQNHAYVDAYTEGVEQALVSAKTATPDIQSVARLCALDEELVERFFRLFARTERVVTVFSQGINQSSFGTDRVNSIINCHLLTGRIGRPGMGPFSITGQPNAMGGREVGGLANQLAAHMAIDNEAHQGIVQEFWQAPQIATTEGLKAVDLFKAVHEGKIKAIWIMATNPAVSMPDAAFVREALEKCECVVVSDCMRDTDTTAYANVLLPSLTWGERDGTVTNSERRISRQRAFLPAPGEAKADWWIISEVAKRMGYVDQFSYQGSQEIFKEHAMLSGYKNQGERDFDISLYADINVQAYDNLQPVQWPVTEDNPEGTRRMFSSGRYFTASKKARFIALDSQQPVSKTSAEYPLVLNTGRIRDQWHTMTRTGKSAVLSAHIFEPYIELHADDAELYQIADRSLVEVSSAHSSVIVRAMITDAQQAGSVFVPIHWNKQFASRAVIDQLVAPNVDPISGQPEFKFNAVNIKTYEANWHGFLLSRRKLDIDQAEYWSLSCGKGLWRYELAGNDAAEDWSEYARKILCKESCDVNWVEYFDQAQQRYRAARIENNRLESCIFIGPDTQLPERDWLIKLFESEQLEETERVGILSGKPLDQTKDTGKIICACHGVGINVIKHAIVDEELCSVDAIGESTRAGTNCGSCVPELRKILRSINKESS